MNARRSNGIERFHSALASLAEIVAFVVLGLTVDLDELVLPGVWIPGVVLGVVVAFVIRPGAGRTVPIS